MLGLEKQERRTREARLLVSRPEEVFKELRSYGAQAKANWSDCNEQLEKSLLERGDPLIDLGLACYDSNEEIVGALYIRKGWLRPTRRWTPAIGKGCGSRAFPIRFYHTGLSRGFRVTLSGRTKRVAYLVRQIGDEADAPM